MSLQCIKFARNSGFARYFLLRETYLNLVSCIAILLHTKYMLKIQIPGHSEKQKALKTSKSVFWPEVLCICAATHQLSVFLIAGSSGKSLQQVISYSVHILDSGIYSVIIYSSKHVFLKVASVFLCSGMNILLFIPGK